MVVGSGSTDASCIPRHDVVGGDGGASAGALAAVGIHSLFASVPPDDLKEMPRLSATLPPASHDADVSWSGSVNDAVIVLSFELFIFANRS